VNPFQRSFVGEIRRIDEMARRVRFFSTQIEKEPDVVPVRPLSESAPLLTTGPRAARTVDELEVKLAEHESRLTKMNESYQNLSERTKELVEARHVLRETAVFFNRVSAAHLFTSPVLVLETDVLARRILCRVISDSRLMTARLLCCSTMTGRTNIRLPASSSTLSKGLISPSHTIY
jgi:hypothetical protein